MKRLSILYLEDNDIDVDLVRSNLEAEGIESDLQRVETRAGFVAALAKGRFDIILTDYALPSFDGMSALKLAAEMCPEVPVIMISGAIGEEIAVDVLKSGATDFVLKRRIERLAPAVERALREAEEVRARRRVEETLRDSEERLQMLFESAPDGYYLSDLRGNFIDGNKAAEELLGYKKEELIGENFTRLSLLSLRELPKAVRSLARNALGLGTGPEEYNLIRKDGSTVPVEIRTHPVRMRGKTVVLGIARDISERKQAEEELGESEDRLRYILENSTNLYYSHTPAHVLTYLSPQVNDVLGYTPEEALVRWTELASDNPVNEIGLGLTTKAIETGELQRPYELELVHKNGEKVWVEVREAPVVKNGRTVSIVGALTDITERKRAEEEVHNLSQFQGTVIDSANVWLDVLDAEANIVVWNRAAEEISGYTREEVVGHDKIWEWLYPDEAYRNEILDTAAINERGEVVEGFETTIQRKDGETRIISWNSRDLMDEDGTKTGAIGLGRDITERVKAEEEREVLLVQIRGQAKQIQQTIDTVPEGVLLLDASGQVILANPVAAGDLAVLADAKVGDIITHLGGRPLAELLTSPPTKGLWHEVNAEGRAFEVIARPMENGAGPENWVLVIRDVTQERESERRTQQQERLAAVGQLAAGIAHDFNNIMAVIVLYTQMGLRLPDIPDQLRDRLQIVDQQAKRATNLIQQILDFSRRAVLERRPMDLTPFLKEIVKLLERTVPESITLELTYGRDEYTVNADPTRMQQAILNLVVNARDAMLPQGGGDLGIELDRVQVARHQTPPLPEMGAGEWVRIAVTDTGGGIPPDVLPHIYEPFFTTKEVGKGTGLGLPQVYGIVKQHEGHIDVSTAVGAGTTFVIYLPALLADRQEVVELETTIHVHGQGETVLVVEDNADLRKALMATLEQLGYRVLEAADGREALDLLEQDGSEIALVLSDLVMPEMGGAALFHTMRQRGLTLPVVMLSGHPMEKEMESLRKQGLAGWMVKPPDMAQLAQLLARVLRT